MKTFNRVCVLLITLAVGTALVIGAARVAWESAAERVLVAIDLNDSEISQIDLNPSLNAPLLLSPDQVARMEDFPAGGVILQLEDWITLVTFQDVLDSMPMEVLRGVYIDAPMINSSEHIKIIETWMGTGEMSIAFNEFSDSSQLMSLLQNQTPEMRIVRAHVIDSQDWTTGGQQDRQRIFRAVKERKISLIIIQSLNIEDAALTLNSLHGELNTAGFSVGQPGVREQHLPHWLSKILLALGLAGLAGWMLVRLFNDTSLQIRWGFLLGLSLIAMVAFYVIPSEFNLAFAWLAAVGAPIGAFLFLRDRVVEPNLKSRAICVLGMSAASILGGLVAAAFLSESSFLLGLEIFRGVKAALIAPIMAVGILSINAMMRHGFGALDTFIMIGVGIALGFMLMRSGNTSAIEVIGPSGSEQSARAILESVLYARPRFKEFLIGHPALWIWAGLASLRWRSLGWGLLLLGMVGQVSIVNSFLHLHTPLEFTLLRVFNGLWLGVLIGVLAQGGVSLIAKIVERTKVKVMGS